MSFILRHKTLFAYTIFIAILALLPLFITSPYYLDVIIVVLINAVLGISFLMNLKAGLINLGVAAFWGVGAYASTMLVMNAKMNFWLALPLSGIVSAIIAAVIGIVMLRHSGFTFLILASVIGMLFVVAVGNIEWLGGYNGIADIPAPDAISLPFLPIIDFSNKVQYFYLALFVLIIIILIANAFYSAWTGRAWTALTLNPRLAQSIGVNVFAYQLLAFVVASGIAGLIGSFYAHYQRYIVPDSFGFFVTIYAQIYAVLGGIFYGIAGPFVGAVVMTLFPEFIRIAKEVAPVIVGVLLIVLIMVLPNGILGLYTTWKFRLQSRFGPKRKAGYREQ